MMKKSIKTIMAAFMVAALTLFTACEKQTDSDKDSETPSLMEPFYGDWQTYKNYDAEGNELPLDPEGEDLSIRIDPTQSLIGDCAQNSTELFFFADQLVMNVENQKLHIEYSFGSYTAHLVLEPSGNDLKLTSSEPGYSLLKPTKFTKLVNVNGGDSEKN